jgi:CRISPR/Cas system-associated exonuclease Cas4 (RecB family)
MLDGDRIRGRWDRVDIEAGWVGRHRRARPRQQCGDGAEGLLPDVVEDTLLLLPPERVTVTDYKSSDVRDPRSPQTSLRSLQLSIYALAYQAETGRMPDAVQLWFLDSGLVGRAEIDDKRLERARARIAKAAAGIRARDFSPRPEPLSCSYCPYRDICPASATA